LLASVDRAIDSAQQIQRDRESGQQGLFAALNGDPAGGDRSLHLLQELPDTPEWPQSLILSSEKETLGFYITGHPLEKFMEQIEQTTTTKVEDVSELEASQEVHIGAMISSLRPLRTRKGDRMATLSLEDLSGSVDAVVFPEVFKRCESLLESEAAVLVRGMLEIEDSGNRKIIVREIRTLDGPHSAPPVTIYVKLEAMAQDLPVKLRSIMEENPGGSRVTFQLEHPQSYLITLQPRHLGRVKADGRFIRQVETLCGAGSVRR
jgi:DNA polymerase-3 subunit alpha